MQSDATTLTERVCRTCGTTFHTRPSYVKKGGGNYCGQQCYHARPVKRALSLEDRFWSKVQRGGPDECWPWTASKTDEGYGSFKWSVERRAHRAAWILTRGPIPDGLDVCHTCDNPPCCNPAHFFLGTNGDNNADRHAKGRSGSARGEQNGNAKLTASAVLEIRAARKRGVRLIDLATQFGVSIAVVHAAATGKTWRSIA
jgi:hypothetical protein